MAILFADIRNFTTLIEKKTPAESFQMLNEYLGEVGPIIRKYNGFIDKYIGDAIMALFEKPDDALMATIDILQLLKKNEAKAEHTSQVISEIGAGIHFGNLMVGTVGEKERMDGTVISDIANTASRLENLNKSYNTHILITEEFLNGLASIQKYRIRFLDHIFAKGKSNSIKIFEVFDADPTEVIEKKERMKPVFEQAIESYRNRRFQEAINSFRECQKILPQDSVLSILIKRCEKYLAEGVPENWEPISKLLTKDDVE
jgi:class 3 adenylate cyclase